MVFLLSVAGSGVAIAQDTHTEPSEANALLAKQDYANAYDKFYALASTHELAQFNSGLFELSGWGRPINPATACQWLEKAAGANFSPHCEAPVAVPRLSLSSTGKVVYTLKTSYRDGTTQVAFEGAAIRTVDFIARLAALVRARSDQNRE